MDFKGKMELLEYEEFRDIYIFNLGVIPVMITAVHTMKQLRKDGTTKLSEPFTKGIARYVANESGASYFIKLKDTNIDSNSTKLDEFKKELLRYIKDNNIRLLIDLHGADIKRDFDVEFGTLNNLSVDFSTVRELEDAFILNGVKNVNYNNIFKGGGITQFVFANTDIDVIQIEINKKYRDIDNYENMEKVCKALISFIEQYFSIINK